jgi:tripartite-type tricarboxylate transporter receptor subunit TctC
VEREREVQNETSPPTISASGRRRCRAPGCIAGREGASLSDAAGARRCGFAAGGPADIVARLIGQWLSERLGQPFVVDNRPGAGGTIGTEAVVRASPDGYTLLLVAGAHTINATLYNKLNFNFIRDIAPVASISRETSVMLVNPSFPAKTVPEFIAYAKANPGKINMASASVGAPSHVIGELFKMMTGVNLVHIAYRGSPPVLTDLLGAYFSVSSATSLPKSAGGREAACRRARAAAS